MALRAGLAPEGPDTDHIWRIRSLSRDMAVGRQGVSWSPDGMLPASYAEAEARPEPLGLVLGTSAETGKRFALLVGCGGEASRR